VFYWMNGVKLRANEIVGSKTNINELNARRIITQSGIIERDS